MSLSIHLTNKQVLWNFWQQLNDADLDQSKNLFGIHYSLDTEFNAAQPINQLLGVHELFEKYWVPLKEAAPDIKRKVDILCAGQTGNKNWVSSTGYLSGTFVNNWLGIPVRGKSVKIR
jgi:hypothetical protein